MRDGALNFQITQFGLSAFTWEPPTGAVPSGRYVARTFNFWIFPRPFGDHRDRRFMSQARHLCTAFQFLQSPVYERP